LIKINPLVADAVGENIDALITLDLRGWQFQRILYRKAREIAGEPLSLIAARTIIENSKKGDTIILTTGFPFLPYKKPELDGLIGTAVIARSLDIALGVSPIVVTEAITKPVMEALMTAAGLNIYQSFEELNKYPHSGSVLTFTKDVSKSQVEAEDILESFNSKLVISIEKPGANENGVYHQGNGSNVTDLVAKTDSLFNVAHSNGIPTIAIGDLGNELGLGILADVLERETPFSRENIKTATGSIASSIEANHIIVCSVSDWGAYGLAAMISFLTSNLDAMHTPSIQSQLLWTAVRCGALDGTGRAEPAVDGFGEEYTTRLVAIMRDVIEITPKMSTKFSTIIERIEKLHLNKKP
tara:strand:+ start:1806 stop:2873 length:1068 start_codon:yes stop_codon:yes gene_type:complete